jgi:hypothetical protein
MHASKVEFLSKWLGPGSEADFSRIGGFWRIYGAAFIGPVAKVVRCGHFYQTG